MPARARGVASREVVISKGRPSAELHRNSGSKNAIRALIVVAVVLLAGLAAIASRSPLGGRSAGLPNVTASPAQIPSPWVLALMGIGGAAALFVVVYAVRMGPGIRTARKRRGRGYGLASAAQLVILVIVVAVAVALLEHRGRLGHQAGLGRAGHRPVHGTHSGGSAIAFLGWLPIVALSTLVVVDVVILAVAFWPARRGEVPPVPAENAARAAVEASLHALESEADPRRAVIAAYRRMELALSDAGLPRRSAESPREYVRRVLGTLEVSAAPLMTLTTLFERARFSTRRIGPSERGTAIDALRRMRDELHMDGDMPHEDHQMVGDATRG